jgi:hypothetical protein
MHVINIVEARYTEWMEWICKQYSLPETVIPPTFKLKLGILKSAIQTVNFQIRTWSVLIKEDQPNQLPLRGWGWCRADAQSRAGPRDRCCYHLPVSPT